MAKTKEQIKQIEMQELDDLKFVMGDPRGRRFIHKLLTRSGLYRCSFNGQSNQTIFNEGARNQGLQLLSEVSDERVRGSRDLMMKENQDD